MNADHTKGTVITADTEAESAEGQEEEPEELSKSQAFDVLRNSRRRAAISHLRDHGGTMSVNELATRVATDEYDVSSEELSSKQYKRVYTGLYQCHLERADEIGVVDFDTDENTVSLRDPASQLDPFLDDEPKPGSLRVELGVATAAALLVSVGWIGAGHVDVVSTTALAVLPIAGLLGLALFQLY